MYINRDSLRDLARSSTTDYKNDSKHIQDQEFNSYMGFKWIYHNKRQKFQLTSNLITKDYLGPKPRTRAPPVPRRGCPTPCRTHFSHVL